MLAKRFEHILHDLGMAGLEHPLFYHAPVGIRFKIGGEEPIYLDTGLIYLQSFAPDMDLQEFEERVCCVMENRMLVDVIDRALLRLKRYPDRGELYYEILTKQFIHRFNSTEKELLDELNMERSVFYDRKREAIFLLSLCLFGYAVPELQEELEMPRLYPD